MNKVNVFGVVNIDDVNQSRAIDMEEIVIQCVEIGHKTPTFNVGHNRPSSLLISTEDSLSTDKVDSMIRIGGICKHFLEHHLGYLEGVHTCMITPFMLGVAEAVDEAILKDAMEEIDYVWYDANKKYLHVKPHGSDSEWLFVETY